MKHEPTTTPPICVPQPKRGVTSPKEPIQIDQLLVESEKTSDGWEGIINLMPRTRSHGVNPTRQSKRVQIIVSGVR
jgi:hypothetical protein